MAADKHILIYDDDQAFCRLILRAMGRAGIDAVSVESADELFARALEPYASLIILDLTLPDVDGLKIARAVKRMRDLPIIMATGRGAISDKLQGFESGADDYLSKPFAMEELIVRVKRLLETHEKLARQQANEPPGRSLPGGWLFDRESWLVLNEASRSKARLTVFEGQLLAYVVDYNGDTVSREWLGRALIGPHWSSEDRGIDVHVSRIRKKLKSIDIDSACIETIRGKGYRLRSRP